MATYYRIDGFFKFRSGDQEFLISESFSLQERHLQAYSLKQATYRFALRFEEKLGRSVYIGPNVADIYEVDPPEKQGVKKEKEEEEEKTKKEKKKDFKQQSMFEEEEEG